MSLDLKLKFEQGYREDIFLGAIHFTDSNKMKCTMIMTEQRLLVAPNWMQSLQDDIPHDDIKQSI